MEETRLRRTKAAEKRIIELEKWKKNKKEAEALMKKISRPPFKPVGKASVSNRENIISKKLAQKSAAKVGKKYVSKISTTLNSRYSSTPMAKAPKIPLKPLPEIANIPINPYRRTTFDKEEVKVAPIEELEIKYTERKSVQFKDHVEKITPKKSPRNKGREEKSPSPTVFAIDDERRRTSYAGRTPFSCTSSRSGSTPGRPNCLLQVTHEDLPESIVENHTKMATPKSNTRRKSRSSGKCLLKWSVPRSSILPRDPYLLRSRTPVCLKDKSELAMTKILESCLVDTTNKSLRKKKLGVSFGAVKIENYNQDESLNKSSIFDDTFCQLNITAPGNKLNDSVTFHPH